MSNARKGETDVSAFDYYANLMESFREHKALSFLFSFKDFNKEIY